MIKKLYFSQLILITLLAVSVIAPRPAWAATPTPSASPKTTAKPTLQPKATVSPTPSPSPAATPDTTQNLKDRINKVLKEQVQGVEDQTNQKKRGFIGEVQRVTETSITLRTNKGSQILNVEGGIVIARDNKKASLDDIAVGDWAIAMGYVNDDAFELKRLLVSSTSLRPRRYQTTIGTLEEIKSTRTSVQIIISPRFIKEKKTFVLAKTVTFQDGQGNPLTQKDLKTDSQYAVISYQDGETLTAILVRALAPGN